MSGTGPVICTVCHVRAAPREDARFAFGNPNNSNQTPKKKDERQFTIEFPHDKHQNVIAMSVRGISFVNASFSSGEQKPDYNNCTICHVTDTNVKRDIVDLALIPPGPPQRFTPPAGTFKTTPRSHDACFNCHWKNQKPINNDCAGCHKAASAFVPVLTPKRVSAKFSHEGGKGEHVMECTTCHINITRASTVRGLAPDVPIAACTTCHKDNKKITYPKAVTIEEEFAQYRKTNACDYCHTPDVGSKKPPASHDAAAQ